MVALKNIPIILLYIFILGRVQAAEPKAKVDGPVVALNVDTSEDKAPDSGAGVIEVENPVHDFGKVGFNNYYNCQFKFKNVGQGPLHISKIESSCGCAVPELDKKTYAPGESGTVKVKYHSPRSFERIDLFFR